MQSVAVASNPESAPGTGHDNGRKVHGVPIATLAHGLDIAAISAPAQAEQPVHAKLSHKISALK